MHVCMHERVQLVDPTVGEGGGGGGEEEGGRGRGGGGGGRGGGISIDNEDILSQKASGVLSAIFIIYKECVCEVPSFLCRPPRLSRTLQNVCEQNSCKEG